MKNVALFLLVVLMMACNHSITNSVAETLSENFTTFTIANSTFEKLTNLDVAHHKRGIQARSETCNQDDEHKCEHQTRTQEISPGDIQLKITHQPWTNKHQQTQTSEKSYNG